MTRSLSNKFTTQQSIWPGDSNRFIWKQILRVTVLDVNFTVLQVTN